MCPPRNIDPSPSMGESEGGGEMWHGFPPAYILPREGGGKMSETLHP
jgi:hypothetical protein